MNEYTLRTLAQRSLSERPYPSTMFPPSPYYRFLKRLAAEMQPGLSVVLGVCGGGCCLHLAQGYSMGKVVGIDNAWDHPEHITYIQQNHANFKFWLGDSIASVPQIIDAYGNVDILFVDTTHVFSQTVAEFEGWLPYLSSNAVVCFDDLFRKEMDGFWDWLQGNKVRLDELHDGSEDGGGFGVWWK